MQYQKMDLAEKLRSLVQCGHANPEECRTELPLPWTVEEMVALHNFMLDCIFSPVETFDIKMSIEFSITHARVKWLI